MRLDKLLAHIGLGSRKEVKQLIRKGYVEVNGQIVKKDDIQVNENEDEIIVDGQKVEYQKNIYLMLNKPAGYVSATYDKVQPTVLDLVDEYNSYHLFPVGRLDIDTVGLMLLTNDGNLAHQILSPKKHISKVYYAKIEGTVTDADIQSFKNGLDLGDFKTLPAFLKIISIQGNESEVEIEIFERKKKSCMQ